MDHKSMSMRFVLGALLVAGLAGCTSTGKNLADVEELTGIRWLTSNLQNNGIAISESGSADLRLPAESSSRLILNGRDVVDVYHFYERFTASAKAYELAGRNPQNDVYLRDNLIVIRYTEFDNGIRLTLHELLGKALQAHAAGLNKRVFGFANGKYSVLSMANSQIRARNLS